MLDIPNQESTYNFSHHDVFDKKKTHDHKHLTVTVNHRQIKSQQHVVTTSISSSQSPCTMVEIEAVVDDTNDQPTEPSSSDNEGWKDLMGGDLRMKVR